jgi:hypothetical protein
VTPGQRLPAARVLNRRRERIVAQLRTAVLREAGRETADR